MHDPEKLQTFRTRSCKGKSSPPMTQSGIGKQQPVLPEKNKD
jgi:hypothetical protein